MKKEYIFMKELKSYYTRQNLRHGAWIGLIMVVLFFLFGVHTILGLALVFLLTTLSTPAIMARDDAIRKWEEENFLDRM